MADDIRLVCWPTPDRLGIGIQVRNLAGQEHHQTEELIQIDTGYSEELLIPQALFEALNLARWQLPDSIAAQGTTVTGQIIKFDEAPVDVIIPKTGEQHRVTAQTFVGNIRFLIGRAFLRRFKVLLDGPESRTCLLIPDSPNA
jgi:predicted aspartyl protease